MSDLDLYYDKINVGKTITCLLHSFRTETPCVLLEPSPPFNLDIRYDNYDFSWLGIDSPKPLQIWDRLCFLLSMSGILLFPNNVLNYRREEGTLVIVSNHNKRINVHYEKINVFDEQETGWSYVYDYYDWKSGGQHKFDEINDTDENFIKSIKFYSSERDMVGSHIKDLVGVSYLSEEELSSMETSHVYSRLKILQMLRTNGILGNVVGYGPTGRAKYRKPVIEFRKRIIKPDYIPEISFKDAYEMEQKRGYTWKLLEKITQHTST